MQRQLRQPNALRQLVSGYFRRETGLPGFVLRLFSQTPCSPR
ncbi:hypothetical protein RRSWK_03758 [Rhodopirellula sp. SWK7]|nr:hypothetical protein RRSWK_03758 [Rhodopirellula sp. SWK7]